LFAVDNLLALAAPYEQLQSIA